MSFHKITNLDVIHLVAKIGENPTTEESAMTQDSTQPTRETRRESAIMGLMNRILRGESSNAGETSGVVPPVIPNMVRRTRRGSREENAHATNTEFNSIECRETIYQNLVTIDNLIHCSETSIDPVLDINEENTNENSSRPSVNIFELSKRKLVKGQWIDVKDTIDQWLEAQVIDVLDNKVYVHYNGWGTRWDEWIEMESNRIMPFRFHTRQATINNFQSPFPNIRPDANVNLFGMDTRNNTSNLTSNLTSSNNNTITSKNNFFDVFDELQKVINVTNNVVNQINNQRKSENENTIENSRMNDMNETNINNQSNKSRTQREVYNLSKKLTPILDRLGRVITDVGAYLNYDLRNNKIEDLDHNLFNNLEGNLDPLLKPFTTEEQNDINEEMLSTANPRGGRNNNAHISPPVSRLDQMFINQVPVVDTPLNILNRNTQTQPVIDIYVHTFVTPVAGEAAHREVSSSSANDSSTGRSIPSVLNNIANLSEINTEQAQIPTEPIQNVTKKEETNVENDDIEIADESEQNYIGRKRVGDRTHNLDEKDVEGTNERNKFKKVRTKSTEEGKMNKNKEQTNDMNISDDNMDKKNENENERKDTDKKENK